MDKINNSNATIMAKRTEIWANKLADALNASTNQFADTFEWVVVKEKANNYNLRFISKNGDSLSKENVNKFKKVFQEIELNNKTGIVFKNNEIIKDNRFVNVIGFDIPVNQDVNALKSAIEIIEVNYADAVTEVFGNSDESVNKTYSKSKVVRKNKADENSKTFDSDDDINQVVENIFARHKLLSDMVNNLNEIGEAYHQGQSWVFFDAFGQKRIILASTSSTEAEDNNIKAVSAAFDEIGLNNNDGCLKFVQRQGASGHLNAEIYINSPINQQALQTILSKIKMHYETALAKRLPKINLDEKTEKPRRNLPKTPKADDLNDVQSVDGRLIISFDDGKGYDYYQPDTEETVTEDILPPRSEQEKALEQQNMQRLADALNEKFGKKYPNQEWKVIPHDDFFSIHFIGKKGDKENLLSEEKAEKLFRDLTMVGIRDRNSNYITIQNYFEMLDNGLALPPTGMTVYGLFGDENVEPVIYAGKQEDIEKAISNVNQYNAADMKFEKGKSKGKGGLLRGKDFHLHHLFGQSGNDEMNRQSHLARINQAKDFAVKELGNGLQQIGQVLHPDWEWRLTKNENDLVKYKLRLVNKEDENRTLSAASAERISDILNRIGLKKQEQATADSIAYDLKDKVKLSINIGKNAAVSSVRRVANKTKVLVADLADKVSMTVAKAENQQKEQTTSSTYKKEVDGIDVSFLDKIKNPYVH